MMDRPEYGLARASNTNGHKCTSSLIHTFTARRGDSPYGERRAGAEAGFKLCGPSDGSEFRSLGNTLHGENLFRYAGGKVHEQEIIFVIEVVLATFVDDSHQIILGRRRIGKNPIYLARNERRLIVGIVNAKSERFGRCFHSSSR